MRYAILLALLPLGASPHSASEALECRLPYTEAVTALDHVAVISREEHPNEDEYRHSRQFDPARLAAFGFPVRSSGTLKVDAISHETLVISTTLKASYTPIRTAALASRGKSGCVNTDGPPGTCQIEEREQDGWTVYFLLTDMRDPTLSCIYTRPSA